MNEQEYAKVIAANLRRIAYEHGKTQADICRALRCGGRERTGAEKSRFYRQNGHHVAESSGK